MTSFLKPNFNNKLIERASKKIDVFAENAEKYDLKDHLQNTIKQYIEQTATDNDSELSYNVIISTRKNFDKLKKRIKVILSSYLKTHTDFVYKDIGTAVKFEKRWAMQNYEMVESDKEISVNFNNKLRNLRKVVGDIFSRVNIDELLVNYTEKPGHDVEHYSTGIVYIREYTVKIQHKIMTLYDKELSILDVIFDNQFIAIYIVKLISFILLLISFNIGESVFTNIYNTNVFQKGKDPPSLFLFIVISLVIHLICMSVIVFIMFALMFLFSRPTNNFIINVYFIKSIIIDYVLYLLLLLILSSVIGSIVQNNKYFRYKTEGIRGTRALKGIIILVALVVSSIPFYAIIL